MDADDLRTAGELCRSFLRENHELDWEVSAGSLEWSCRRTVEHVSNALEFYIVHLALRAPKFLPAVGEIVDTDLPIKVLVNIMGAKAGILRELIAAAPDDVRAFHTWGIADRSGFAGIGCDELLVHTNDVALGLDVDFDPPRDLCSRVLERLFPWAPKDTDAWQALLWANDRVELDDHGRIGEGWCWWCRPLAEWDGQLKRRDDVVLMELPR